jgi:hypothetical protein
MESKKIRRCARDDHAFVGSLSRRIWPLGPLTEEERGFEVCSASASTEPSEHSPALEGISLIVLYVRERESAGV